MIKSGGEKAQANSERTGLILFKLIYFTFLKAYSIFKLGKIIMHS